MTVEAYEKSGGFTSEFAHLRVIGLAITSLEEAIPCRPHRMPEREALHNLRFALEQMRREIAQTRNG